MGVGAQNSLGELAIFAQKFLSQLLKQMHNLMRQYSASIFNAYLTYRYAGRWYTLLKQKLVIPSYFLLADKKCR